MFTKNYILLTLILSSLIFIYSPGYAQQTEEKRVTLRELAKEALENNPRIIAARYTLEAMKAVPPQVSSWPDPEIAVSIEKIPEDNISISEAEKIYSISQSFPFPGKLGLKGKMAQWDVEKFTAEYRTTVLKVLAELKIAYYDLYFINKSIEITNKNLDILKKLEKTAQARYIVGKGIQQDIVKAQVEISRLYETLEILNGRKESIKALIRSILNRPPDSPVGVHEEIKKSPLEFNFDQLLEIALRRSPELFSVRIDVEKNRTDLELARREYLPDFTAKVAMRQMDGSITGYDAMLGMSIPIYFYWKQRKGVEEKANFLSEALKKEESLKQSIAFRLKDFYVNAITSQKVITLYEKAIIPQAVISLESAIKAYEVGKVDFLTPLEALTRLLNDELSYYREIVNYQENLARIEEITDSEIIR